MSGSKIFRRNRALGYVSNQVPAVIRYIQRRKDNLVITCIGRSFQVYTSNHFRLLHVSNTLPDDITCMAVDRFHIYTACNKLIYAWRAGKHVKHIYRGHNKNVHLMLPFKSNLIAIDDDNLLKVWNVWDETVYLEIQFNRNEFRITAVAHLPTYINKILLGSEQGKLQLWNIKENKLVYTFLGRSSKVTVIEPAPAIDVAAIGCHDGTISLLNLKYDEIIVEFRQDWGPVTRISFRTDGPPIMATSSTNGNIVFWDLEGRKVDSQITAHSANVTTTICFPNEPLMLTTSPDNSMKLWIFDLPDGGARLLRIREGHKEPPLFIRYHGANGKCILTSGEDSSMRVFSLISETLNKSLGRASYNRKASKKKNKQLEDPLIMPPIVQFTSETTRDKEWDSIAAIHSGIIQTTTWSFHKSKMGELKLVPEQFHNKNRKNFNSETTCLILSHCGNFVIIGYSSGDVERFNIQSGLHRARYGAPAHVAGIRGVACDNLNQVVVSGCNHGIIKFWNFKEHIEEPIDKKIMSSGVTLFCLHRESAMLCIGVDDFTVCILDCDTRVIVRKFEGHTGKITDVTFSPDSRWLITAAMDSTIKVWDIPSSYMIDHFKTERPCTSLTMSPTGDFLATAHVNCLGVYLWANKSLFSQLSLRSINPFDEALYIDLPANQQNESTLDTAIEEMNLNGEELDLNYKTPHQITDDLVTLSGLATSRWQNLLDLDIIKMRNKPKAPPRTPKQAPFFLPTLVGADLKFDLSNAIAENDNSKILIPDHFNNLTAFGKLLETTTTSLDNFEKSVEYLKGQGPSTIDFELKSLHPIGGGSYKAMLQFLKMIVFMFEQNSNFELAQAYLASFLKANGRSLTERQDLVDYLKEVEQAQAIGWKNIEQKFLYGLGVVTALRNYVS